MRAVYTRSEKFDEVMINDQPSTDFKKDIVFCNIADSFDYCQKTGHDKKHTTLRDKSVSSIFLIPTFGLH